MARKTTLPAHQKRSRESLERLIKATEEILEKDGLEGATIPRIAARAGLSPGAVYRRFPDKDALLREVCARLFETSYRQGKEKLKPELWEGVSLADMSRRLIGGILKGYRMRRGLLRALFLFILQHPDAAFYRKGQELQSRIFRGIGELMLTRRDEIHHPDPDVAVRFGMLMVAVAAQGVFILPHNPKKLALYLPDAEEKMERELPTLFLRYLGVEEGKLAG
jgi:AcrR family transcriptional regulator